METTRKRRWWRWVVAAVGVLAIPAAIVFALQNGCTVLNRVKNSHAAHATVEMIIAYMEANDGRWPKGWEDLRQVYDGPHEYFAEVPERIEVDWTADPVVLRDAQPKTKGPPFRVIWYKDGSSVHPVDDDPNQVIFDYWKRSGPAEPRDTP
jgi:hypothetical protein